ncbi:TonB-dependent receptor [Duganella sp. Root1480D1]|uniref:TonB-dependent receptor n=1 Tax=Duganella sp. Root1480D1 TaxID=1736471 RepID=UPI0007097CBA|nr:TonB-dependent receptor [Duganella sp. Root1480D1]KQZ30326.1 TonB-dependent receptor [Duganella sp. Root1480D1]
MRIQYKPLAAMLAAMGFACPAHADHVVTINGGRPTSLPTQIPTTIEGITGAQVEDRINAFDSEDALKYLPSLNVRKRFIGDYDHAVLASRASGTGNSARSLVYADGILLSNLLGNGATYTPRWGLVTPEEIERVDVLYGPFSAAYPGNSVGAVVDFQTRMPSKLEAHAKLSWVGQDFAQYATDSRHTGRQYSASLGDRSGGLSWWMNLSRLDSNGQPIGFANKLLSAGATPKPGEQAGVPVTGAVADRNPSGKDWYILGSTGQVNTVQDHAKLKLAYDFSPTLRASYTLGWWQNDVVRSAESYLRDGAGNAVTSGAINIGGKRFTLLPSDFAGARADLEHVMHGLSLKTHGRGSFNWEVSGSAYDYSRDLARVPTGSGQGNLTDMGGSGWNTLALRGNWRAGAAHQVEFGVQRESAKLRTHVTSVADWIAGEGGKHVSTFNGNTRLESLYAQDTWRLSSEWKATLGLRHETWSAYGGEISGAAGKLLPFSDRREQARSPKAALAWRVDEAWTLKASTGRAVRNPTAAELFQGSIVDDKIVNTDPNLRAEKSWTGELTAEHMTAQGSLRATLFGEVTRDALYSQPLTATVNTVQNVGKIRTWGLELSQQADHVLTHGLTLQSSLTYADSEIAANDAMPSSVGKRQPRVPKWRANALASYHVGQHWTGTFGVRYSGKQFGTLDNSDPSGSTYMGVSDYLVADVRVRYRFNRQWTASVGIDNLSGEKYWAFHPYAQRTVSADLKFDL